ncbi:hemophore-related protein [Nocardia sp. NPDC005978]|uniref:hemophore-related protein n=1 Tax=Nocardia sp. NPDC005978 TaxID=3156725 RepID=UPI0033B47ADC
MRLISSHGFARSAVLAGFALSAMLTGAGAASADPMSDLEPILNSSCSFSQIDAALHEVSPETAAQLDAAPAQKNAIKAAYDQPVEQRRAAFQALIAQQQQMGAVAQDSSAFGSQMDEVVATCSQY